MEQGKRPASDERPESDKRRRLGSRLWAMVAFSPVTMFPPWGREPILAGAGRDLWYALRRLREAPAFSLFTIASLSIAIGTATAVYAVVHAVMGPPPGIADPHRVLAVTHVPQGGGLPAIQLSWPDYEDLRERQDVFDRVVAWGRLQIGYATRGTSRSGIGERVTGDYFDALGVGPALGRVLRPSDDDPGAPAVAVISDRTWRQMFARDAGVLGETIRVNGADYEIVGVVTDAFRGLVNGGLTQTSVWLPMGATRTVPAFESAGTFDLQSRDRRWVMVLGRLAPDRSSAQAMARVAAIARQLDEEFPSGAASAAAAGRTGWTVKPIAGRVSSVPDLLVRSLVAALLTAVGLVLLAAAANLASLSIARATRRRHDLSVRAALGASRFRLVRETLSESALLGVAGGALGLLVAREIMRVLSTELPQGVQLDPRFDGWVFLWSFGATTLVLIVAGLVPALWSTRALRLALDSEGATLAGPWRGRRALVTVQVAVSATLVMLASVSVAHIRQQAATDFGIDLDRLALAEIEFGRQGYEEPEVRRIVDEVVTRLRRPGVESVSVSSGLPLSLRTPELLPPGATVRLDEVSVFAELIAATPGIASTLDVSLVHGRLFDARDASGPPVVVLNETTAATLFGSSPAVGRSVTFTRRRWGGDPQHADEVRTVIGVVADRGIGAPGRPEYGVAYLPFDQHYESRLVIAVRAAGDPALLVDDLRQVIAAIDPRLATRQIGTGRAIVAPDTAFQQLVAGTGGLLGTFAFVLALAGLYGAMAHLVAARTREIGLRIALGATAGQIQRMVILEGLDPVMRGLAAGCGLAVLVGLSARATLYGLDLHAGVLAFASVGMLFVLAGVVACYLPARHASHVDPNHVLRSE